MTTFQNTQAPSINVNRNVIRKLTLLVSAAAGAALLSFVVSNVDLAQLFTTVVDWSASLYFVVLVGAVVGISALGVRQNLLESRKTQFDIR